MKTEVCVRIKVNRQHILDGNVKEPSACAIAQAIREACPDEKTIHVAVKEMVVGNAKWKTPDKGRAFIRAFDRTGNKPDPDHYGQYDRSYDKDLARWEKKRMKLKPFTLVLRKEVDDCSVLRGGAHE